MRYSRAFIIAAVLVAATACDGGPTVTDPISEAILRGETAEVERLLRNGLSAEGRGEGFTPLAWAARTGNVDAIDLLVAAGADTNRHDPRIGWPPLIHAIHKGRDAAVQRLMRRGASVNATTRGGVTPLMVAAGDGRPAIVRLLLDAGANPELRRGDGATALTLAVSGGALTDLERPLLGRCQPEIVQMIKAKAPNLRLGSSRYDDVARVFARWNKCKSSLAMARQP